MQLFKNPLQRGFESPFPQNPHLYNSNYILSHQLVKSGFEPNKPNFINISATPPLLLLTMEQSSGIKDDCLIVIVKATFRTLLLYHGRQLLLVIEFGIPEEMTELLIYNICVKVYVGKFKSYIYLKVFIKLVLNLCGMFPCTPPIW